MNKSIPSEAKFVLLTKKLGMWENTLYDARLDAEIAEMLGDKPLAEQSQARMKSALKAIGFVNDKLSELTKEE